MVMEATKWQWPSLRAFAGDKVRWRTMHVGGGETAGIGGKPGRCSDGWSGRTVLTPRKRTLALKAIGRWAGPSTLHKWAGPV
jgi:hypothetical protein